MKVTNQHKAFGGQVKFIQHDSDATKTPMTFSVFEPEGIISGAIFWLSGLTCTEQNFITKAAALEAFSKHRLLLICPDTSPRGLSLPHEHADWDFGSGASFYVDALSDGYKDHYQMYRYISEELYALMIENYPIKNKVSIMGHSMGGHGALLMGLKNPGKFNSVSAFAPIVNPMQCPWGKKAFMGYLGEDRQAWLDYDACELIRQGKKHPNPILISQGTEDEFLESQLRPENFMKVCDEYQQPLNFEYQSGYDHSYYFISSFIQQHITFHQQYLV
jgi:S-formylglutathione hydrolase